MDRSTKTTIWFFTIYVVLMASLISAVVFVDFDQLTSSIKQNSESDWTFQKERVMYERSAGDNRHQESKPLLFNVSDEAAIIAVTAGAILDIVIVILWARRENKKIERNEVPRKKRWRDTKLFWNIVAMGVIQPKDGKYAVNWFNMIGVTILVHVLLYFLLANY